MLAVAGVVVSTMTCAFCWRWWVSALLRRQCLLTWLVCVWLCRGFSSYHLDGVGNLLERGVRGDLLFCHMASVYIAAAVACGHGAYLLLFWYVHGFSR